MHHLLIDGSRLSLLRKTETCGKSTCPFVYCRMGVRRNPDSLKGKNQGSESDASSYLYLRGKPTVLEERFPQRPKSQKAILLHQLNSEVSQRLSDFLSLSLSISDRVSLVSNW